MSKPTPSTNTKLMDTSPGGENTQYEGAKVFMDQTKPEKSLEGDSQFGKDNHSTDKKDSDVQSQEKKTARGEKTAENIRFGESISEHGFGGETVGNEGGVSDGVRDSAEKEGAGVRKAMGYGDGKEEGDEIGA